MKFVSCKVLACVLLFSMEAQAGDYCRNAGGGKVYCDSGKNFYKYGNRIQTNDGQSWHVDPKSGRVSGTSDSTRGSWYNPKSGAWGTGGHKPGVETLVVPEMAK